jgi:hypothetical protein
LAGERTVKQILRSFRLDLRLTPDIPADNILQVSFLRLPGTRLEDGIPQGVADQPATHLALSIPGGESFLTDSRAEIMYMFTPLSRK